MSAEPPADRRFIRPRMSLGTMIGFAGLAFTVIGATLWLGDRNRVVDETVSRVERIERSSEDFKNEMRVKLDTLQNQVTVATTLLTKFVPEPVNVRPRR